MSEESLRQALGQDGRAVLECLRGLPEGYRRRLAPMLLDLHKAWSRAGWGVSVQGLGWRNLAETLPAALLATATLSELKKLKIWHHDENLVLALLRDRRPTWVAEWVTWHLERNPRCWPLVRRLMAEGWLARPDHENYWLGMIVAASRGRGGAMELLRQQPDLIVEIERLFEIEGQGEFSLAAYDKYVQDDNSWSYALRHLSEQARLDRQTLLECSLRALGRDFEAFRAGWYSRFHEALQPTLEEREALLERYLPLLASRIRPTMSFALKALTLLHKAGRLTSPQWWDFVAPAVTSPDKGTALGALKLSLAVHRSNPSSRLPETLALALSHPHVDVQECALQALEKWLPQPDPADWRAAPGAASLQQRWAQWVGRRVELEKLEPMQPTVSETVAIRPYTDLDELVQGTARILETPAPAWEIERWLDGLLRFPRPEDPRRTAPLLKRARKLLNPNRLRGQVAALVCRWLGQQGPAWDPPQPNLEGFLRLRLDEVAGHLGQGGLTGLRSLPDQPAGWISSPRPGPGVGPWDDLQTRLRSSLEGPALEVQWVVKTDLYECFEHRHLEMAFPFGEAADCAEVAALYACGPSEDPDWRRWQATLWPAARELWMAQGLPLVAGNLDWWEAAWGDRVYLENLLEDQPFGPLASLMLAFGLACKQSEQCGLAIDAAILALSRQHLDGSRLGQALVEAANTDMIKPGRWARSLETVAQEQPQGMLEALEVLIARSQPSFDLGPLLPLLWELSHRLQRPLQAVPALQRLSAWPGSGKAARLAHKLAQRG